MNAIFQYLVYLGARLVWLIVSAAGKAEKELRGVKRYVNIFYRIYNGRRTHDILPMKF